MDLSEGDLNLSPRGKAFRESRGGRGRELLEADAKGFLHQSLSSPCLNALQSASGSELIDLDGKRILDFHGNNVHLLGHGHPEVTKAVKAVLDRLPFCPRRYTNREAVDLSRKLCEKAGAGFDRALFAPGGSLAIGMALKVARLATGRHKVLALEDSFHGASLDAISVGGEALFRDGLGPLFPGVTHMPPPVPASCGWDCGEHCNAACGGAIADRILEEGDYGAVLVETVRCTDVQIPPPVYYETIREACDRTGTLLILDEIPICLGRTGAWFTYQHYGIEPDILVLGKGLGGGVFPMAAMLTSSRFNEAVAHTAVGHYTHEKSPAGAAAGLATIGVLEKERLVERSRSFSNEALKGLRAISESSQVVREVRGLGLLFGVEIQNAPDGRPAESVAEAILYDCLESGLSFKVGKGRVLALSPPLNVSEADWRKGLDCLARAVERAELG